MLRKTVAVVATFHFCLLSHGQILGGGPQFSNAVLFNQSWISGCPSAGVTLSNELAYEPVTAMDPCAPIPTCPSGNSGSDVWFSFFAQDVMASIVVNPGAGFNAAIQAFSGSSCPGLTDIGCVDNGGNNETEILQLTGLTVNKKYYFRIFGSSSSLSNRTTTGTYNFCGSTQLGSNAILAVNLVSLQAQKQKDHVLLNWATATEQNSSFFEIERSNNGVIFESIGRQAAAGNSSVVTRYSYVDVAPVNVPVSYYRLKETNTMGGFMYSAAVTIKNERALQNSLVVLVNPVHDNIKAVISSDVAANTILKVINALGQVIYAQKSILVKGDNLIVIPVTSQLELPNGIYTLQAVTGNTILNTRFESIR